MPLKDNIESKLTAKLKEFGVQLALDLNKSFNIALKKGGSKNVQQADMQFDPLVNNKPGVFNVQVIASDKYWRWVEHGRNGKKYRSTDPKAKANPKGPPGKAFKKKWQNKLNIDPRKIIFDLTIEYNKRKGFKRNVKRLPFDKAATQYAFLVARKIKRDGIKPKPFKDQVIDDGRLEVLQKDIAEIIDQEITIDFTI